MADSPHLASRTWREVPRALLFVPLGSTEQHGPHLPATTDLDVASAVASAVLDTAGEELNAVLAPALPYGSSGEHAGFPGTLSIGQDALRAVLVELVRSAGWVARVALLNGHGGNAGPLAAAVTQLRDEGRDVGWLPCGIAGGDAHAGRTETSLLLRLRPEAVGEERPTGTVAPIGALMGELRARGVRTVSPSGVLGDARGASAVEGEALLAGIVAAAVRRLRAWLPGANGLLEDRG